jgi:hypothetical protein
MLGVHRPSITVSAGILQRAGLIRYAGGQITVIDHGDEFLSQRQSVPVGMIVRHLLECCISLPLGTDPLG